MSAPLLLEHYAQITDTPNAIGRLRRFILDLAVAGRLVESDGPWKTVPVEGCLEVLPDGHRIHQGWSPQCEATPSPNAAVWGVLKTTAIQDGFFLADQNKTLPPRLEAKTRLEVQPGDILITCAGPRARCGIACLVGEVRERLLISGKMYRFRANKEEVLASYLEIFLRSSNTQSSINSMKTGSSESGLNLTKDRFRTLAVSYGTIAEQERIVAKVDELMALCKELEAARAEREASRDKLAAASLARLNAPSPETSVRDARFALDNLGPITSRADQIKALRETILNLAVRGKLVAQNPNDEAAAELLRKLHSRNNTKSYKRSTSQGIASVDVPFEAPAGWVWTEIQDVLATNRDVSYGVIKLGDQPKSGGVSTLRCSDVRPGFIDLSNVRKVSADIEADYERTRLSGGEVVINIRGTLGGVALITPLLKGFNVAREVAVVPIAPAISGEFMVYLMLSPYFWDHIQNNLRGIAYKGLNLGTLRELPIPLPPVAEQQRIVAEVDRLLAICDELVACLDEGEKTRSNLLEAALCRTLGGA